MLRITIPDAEHYDEASGAFISVKEQILQLEHSLVSVSKWESKWHKPFLVDDPRTEEEWIDYVRCMTITQNVNAMAYYAITANTRKLINAYLEDSMTATWFNERQNRRFSRDIITSEVIYYWMVALGIPFECEKWHLNRLLTLIRVCNIKNTPAKKMNPRDIMRQNRAINNDRKMKTGSRG